MYNQELLDARFARQKEFQARQKKEFQARQQKAYQEQYDKELKEQYYKDLTKHYHSLVPDSPEHRKWTKVFKVLDDQSRKEARAKKLRDEAQPANIARDSKRRFNESLLTYIINQKLADPIFEELDVKRAQLAEQKRLRELSAKPFVPEPVPVPVLSPGAWQCVPALMPKPVPFVFKIAAQSFVPK